jgi:hypothetical protein
MKEEDLWITYRTRFLVRAKQLTATLAFTDALGRQHSGCEGDYLVEFSGGIFRIVSREFFEDVYVPLLSSQEHNRGNFTGSESAAILRQESGSPRHHPWDGPPEN